MIDLRWLREHPQLFDAALQRRGLPAGATAVLEADEARRTVESRLQDDQAERNRLSREIGERRRRGEPTDAAMAEVALLRDRVQAGEGAQRAAQARLDELLAGFPNVLSDDVPDGRDERDNRVERSAGTLRETAFRPLSHDDLGRHLGFDPKGASRLSGSRFALLRGQLARLHRAIGQFMLDVQTQEHGYTEIDPPYLVREQMLFGTGQLPKFGEDLFKTTSDLWLIPTAEVPLTNLVRDEILEAAVLPLRFTACTPCFRSEAGAAGRDTRGFLRVHQFMKVELVSVTLPDQSDVEHERMTACAETILARLELPYRRVLLCAGDTGFAARKTYDLEVWLPGQGAYREISSCSNCGDFQARRMNARYRPGEGKGTRFVHTLNGSGLAVGRALIAIMENCQDADGSMVIPEALRPYVGGTERLRADG